MPEVWEFGAVWALVVLGSVGAFILAERARVPLGPCLENEVQEVLRDKLLWNGTIGELRLRVYTKEPLQGPEVGWDVYDASVGVWMATGRAPSLEVGKRVVRATGRALVLGGAS